MSIRIRQFFLATCVLVICALPTDLPAMDLATCGEDIVCDCGEQGDYEQCIEFDMNNLVDVSDPYAVNDAYNIETVWNDAEETWEMSAEITTARTHVLPVHPNRGEWESMEQLNDYLRAMLQPGDGPGMGLCELYNNGTPLRQVFSGYYGRWDSQDGEWAQRQYRGFVYDLISGPNGELVVNGADISREVPDFNEGYWWSGAGHLSAHQYSNVSRNPVEGNEPCHDVDGEPDPIPDAMTRIDEVKWHSIPNKLGNGVIVTNPLDSVDMQARYYEGTGIQIDQVDPNVTLVNGYALIRRTDTPGTCGYGHVEKGGDSIEQMTTRAGSAPNPCPSRPNPSW